MSRYIDADNFYASQAARCWGEPIIGTCTSDKALLYDELQKLPISDALEVIRCKDCKHKVDYKGRVMCGRRAGIIGLELYGLSATSNDNYCSYGEIMD